MATGAELVGAAAALGGDGGVPPAAPEGAAPPAAPEGGAPPAMETPPTGAPGWATGLSDQGEGDALSDAAWLSNKGYADLSGLVKATRGLETKIGQRGAVVPGEGASAEEVAAFHKAIGVPDSVDGYAVQLGEGETLDDGLVGPLREAALKAGVPAPAFAGLAAAFVQNQKDRAAAAYTEQSGLWDGLQKEWGALAPQKTAEFQAGVRALGMTADDIAAMQMAVGADKVGRMFQRIGADTMEAGLIGGAKKSFGVTGAEAQAEIDRLSADPDFRAKLTANDPTAKARWERLNGAVAQERDRVEAAARG